MNLAADLRASLQDVLVSGTVEIRENGGLELQPAPPLVYLIGPALRFHPTSDILQRYLSRDIEIIRVGLVESWRRGLRVMFRQ